MTRTDIRAQGRLPRLPPGTARVPAGHLGRFGPPHGDCAVGLAGLLVEGVTSVPRAELLHLDPLTVVHLVLGGDVVAALARLAGQGDLDPLLISCHGDSLVPVAGGHGSDTDAALVPAARDLGELVAAAGLEPATPRL